MKILLVVLSTLDAMPEYKNCIVKNLKRIDRQLNWSKHSEMIISVLSHMTAVMHLTRYLMKGGDQVSLEEPSSEVVIHMKRKTKHHSKNY